MNRRATPRNLPRLRRPERESFRATRDAEDLKKSIVGDQGSRFNISVGDYGDVFLTPVRRGAGPPVETGFMLDELPDLFPFRR
jgi:hypothetical protein